LAIGSRRNVHPEDVGQRWVGFSGAEHNRRCDQPRGPWERVPDRVSPVTCQQTIKNGDDGDAQESTGGKSERKEEASREPVAEAEASGGGLGSRENCMAEYGPECDLEMCECNCPQRGNAEREESREAEPEGGGLSQEAAEEGEHQEVCRRRADSQRLSWQNTKEYIHLSCLGVIIASRAEGRKWCTCMGMHKGPGRSFRR